MHCAMARPLALRIALVLAALSSLAALAASSAVGAPQRRTVALSSLEGGVLDDLNALRAQHHLAPLRLSAQLTAAARSHTVDMAAQGYFEHESADGTAFWKRIERFYPSHRYSSWSVGENLLWVSPDTDAHSALQDWLDSPKHRANMLKPGWRDIGVAAVHVTAAPGDFEGQDVTILTTDFGARR
jgi:uncharacterized protein YkwD